MIIFRHNHRWWVSPNIWLYRLIFWLGATAVGVFAVFFAKACLLADHLFVAFFAKYHWITLIITPCVFATSAYLTRNYFAGSQGSGIPQTIAAMHLKTKEQYTKLLSLKITFGKIILTVLGLLGGASIGREGPSVQIGASIMAHLGKFLKFS